MIQAWMQKNRKQLLIGVPVGFTLVCFLTYLLTGRYESTDNAYIQAARMGVNSNVPGQVIKIFVKENQRVTKGDPLFELDDRSYRISIENAKAKLTNAQLQVLILKANYYAALAQKIEAENNYAYAEKEYHRQQDLAKAQITSEMDLDKVENEFNIAREQFNAAEQGMIAALADLNNDPMIPLREHPLVQEAQANLNYANLNYEYTVTVAPFDGYVTKVDQLQPGDFINSGEPVFALVSDSDIWVEANFKETQITYMKPDQYVTIDIDAYPDKEFTGRVLSLSPGTGQPFLYFHLKMPQAIG